jgi:hypothetical protein
LVALGLPGTGISLIKVLKIRKNMAHDVCQAEKNHREGVRQVALERIRDRDSEYAVGRNGYVEMTIGREALKKRPLS